MIKLGFLIGRLEIIPLSQKTNVLTVSEGYCFLIEKLWSLTNVARGSGKINLKKKTLNPLVFASELCSCEKSIDDSALAFVCW